MAEILRGLVGDNVSRRIRLDDSTHALHTIDYPHHEIHSGSSYTAQYSITTAATSGHRSGIYIKTPAVKEIHLVVSFSATHAADASIQQAPTIAANIGTHAVQIINRNLGSSKTSQLTDNATVPAANKITTLSEAQIAGDGTWALGTVVRDVPLTTGTGPKPLGGNARSSQEYILKPSTAYVFLLTNTAASANTHHILIDWYEHTARD